MTLAVYHASADVEQHIAALRRTKRFKVACFPQDSLARRIPTSAFDGVLWELSPGSKVDRRRLSSLARGSPVVVSYSTDGSRDVADLSRAIGFPSHLRAPLSPVEVEHRISLVAEGDLATRLRRFQATLRRNVYRVDVLGGLLREVGLPLEPAAVAQALILRVAEWIQAPCWAVAARNAAGDLELLAVRGLPPPLEPAARGVARWVADEGTEYATADLQQDDRMRDAPAVAAIGFPLVCRGATVGAVIAVDSRRSGRTPRLAAPAQSALRALLEPAAIALDNALRMERVEALSVTDDLTQLYNSRYLHQALHRETKRAGRTGRPLSVLFVDLDGFKSINDAHGHLRGSQALVEAAAVIRGSARETDLVARFGGDEFAVVLPDADQDGALAVGARIRERIAAHQFLESEGLQIRLSASVGVATLPDVAISADGLLQAADRAMYWVKDHGKNAIRVADRQDDVGPSEAARTR